LATTPSRLVHELSAQLEPSHIGNCAREPAVSQHAFDVKILDADGVKTPGNACANLVQAVAADAGDPRV
jgi:hypothetical protein